MPKKKEPGIADLIDAIHANTNCVNELKTVVENLSAPASLSTVEAAVSRIETVLLDINGDKTSMHGELITKIKACRPRAFK